MSKAAISVEGTTLYLVGSWTLSNIGELTRAVESARLHARPDVCAVSGDKLEHLDSVGAGYVFKLTHFWNCGDLTWSGLSSAQQKLIQLVAERISHSEVAPKQKPEGLLQKIGKSVSLFFNNIAEILSFFGQLLMQSSKIRLKELFVQLERGLVDAIGIISLVSLLIGVVVAYLFAIQLERYGGNIFIVDSVSVAMCRELAPVVAAIIVAGRSGSAFTAQIGAMKLNEEIDAMQTLGLSPMQVLVLPRVIALMIALPLLTFVGDVVSIIGGVIVADVRLDITLQTFIERLDQITLLKHAVFGVCKAPVFALFIATIGCRMGMRVKDTAKSVGENTTSTVVQSIVAVIILNAIFAVTAAELGI